MGKLLSHLRNQWMGALALFVALGGTAYAAVELEKNDVKSKHIKNAAVKSKDLANDSVSTRKVADGSLLGLDFAAGELPAGPQGDTGATGPQGEQGLQGERGPAGATNVTVRSAATPPSITGGEVRCQPGERAIGGGFNFQARTNDVPYRSGPMPSTGTPTGWHAAAYDTSIGSPDAGTVYVVCASP